MIDLSDKQRGIISGILQTHASGYEVRAYGSRVNGTSHAGSDLDLVVIGNEKPGWENIAKLKEAFEESNLPFRVDILDWNSIPESFQKNIKRQYTVLQEKH
jgi:predicted nucleotidyltransferase